MAQAKETCALPDCCLPCWEDGFCSRAHASEALQQGIIASLAARDAAYRRDDAAAAAAAAACADDELQEVIIASLTQPQRACKLDGCDAPVYFNHDAGHYSEFCCPVHADIAIELGEWLPPVCAVGDAGGAAAPARERCMPPRPPEPALAAPAYAEQLHAATHAHAHVQRHICQIPGCDKPAWVDAEGGGETLPFCSARHAVRMGLACGDARCSMRGCPERVVRHPATQEDLHFCSEEHRMRAARARQLPNTAPGVEFVWSGSDLPGRCLTSTFRLSLLTRRHDRYASIRKQFLDSWGKHHDSGTPTLERIFEVKVPDGIFRAYKAYEAQKQRYGATVKRRFHGTGCKCDFYVRLTGGPCGDPTCAVCNICTHGFSMRYCGGGPLARGLPALRYGRGLYFSSVSGKSNDYAQGSRRAQVDRRGVTKNWHVMFVCNVIAGQAYRTTDANHPGPYPPNGYDSMVGEPSPGGLNYDELVVYREDAAIPAYMITYTLP